MANTTSKSGNHRAGCLFIIVTGIFLVCLAMLLIYIALPNVLNVWLQHELRQRGAEHVNLQLLHVGVGTALTGPVAIGTGDRQLTADMVRIEYDLSKLFQGQIRAIEIVGLRVHVEETADGYHVAGLDALQDLLSRDPAAPRKDSELPAVESLKLRAAEVLVHSHSQPVRRIGANGQGRLSKSGKFAIRTVVTYENAAVTLEGEGRLPQPGRTAATFDGEVLVQYGTFIAWPGAMHVQKIPSRFKVDLAFAQGESPSWNARAVTQPEWQDLEFSVGEDTTINGQGRISVEASGDSDHVLFEAAGAMRQPNLQASWGTLSFEQVEFSAQTDAVGKDDQAADRTLFAGRLSAVAGEGVFGEYGAVAGVSFEIPFAWRRSRGIGASEDGGDLCQWSFEHAVIGGFKLGKKSTGCSWTDDGLVLEASLQANDVDAELNIRQTIALKPSFELQTEAAVPFFHIGASQGWYKRIGPLAALRIDGTVAARGKLAYVGQELGGDVQVLFEGVDIALSERTSVTELRGDVTVQLPELIVPLHQTLQFTGGSAAGIPFGAGEVQLTLQNTSSLFLEQARVEWCGGLLRTYAVQLDFSDPEFDAVVYAENVELKQVLGLIKGFDGNAQGTLYGQLPFHMSNGNIKYGKGFLYNVPGQTGILQIQDPEIFTSGIIGEQETYGNLQLAERALRNFRFSLFKMDFAGEGATNTRLTIQLAGESRADESLPPVNLTVNVRGALDEYINLGLGIGRIRDAIE